VRETDYPGLGDSGNGPMGLFERKFVMGSGAGGSLEDRCLDATRLHGCSVRIDTTNWESVCISHESSSGIVTYPTVRSYPDGIKVGCSFVSTSTLEKIFRWHQEFLSDKGEKTWQ